MINAVVYYLTVALTVVLLSMKISQTWVAFAVLDIIFIAYLYSNLKFEEFIKYSGYKIWYKLIKE